WLCTVHSIWNSASTNADILLSGATDQLGRPLRRRVSVNRPSDWQPLAGWAIARQVDEPVSAIFQMKCGSANEPAISAQMIVGGVRLTLKDLRSLSVSIVPA